MQESALIPNAYAVPKPQYLKLHEEAMRDPLTSSFERPLVLMFRQLRTYATRHQLRYGTELGADAVLGRAWLRIAEALIALLDGETGRIDPATMELGIRAMARAYGFSDEEAGQI